LERGKKREHQGNCRTKGEKFNATFDSDSRGGGSRDKTKTGGVNQGRTEKEWMIDLFNDLYRRRKRNIAG